MTTIVSIEYYGDRAYGHGKSFALAAAIDAARQSKGFWLIPGHPVVSFDHRTTRHQEAELQLYTHNILFNVRPRPRPRDPALPLAGTVFDPRRYRRP
ncbi:MULTISPECIES: hypothetical protein [unclassified Rhizobium]|uniref:hypothetical protein n=1 Tax=unclassified Rhizobium TaxID=2613769 RepID=UPI0007EA56F6|nr:MULTISPECIES: hypothetical protein [unclassified Rhizobium]ANL12050.1 hypothetical protein AMJ98_PA00104 [Rhizobium sp. N1341]ANM42895.1 hypothetical protein AMK03_PA00104 [Rhizobium sp. N741]